MELKRMVAPFDATEALAHLEQIFGIQERLLETCQLNGSETTFNKDIVYLAYENDTLLGMIHATIPVNTPYLAGLSAMFTTEAARGKGIGKILFEKIVEEVSSHDVRLAVLGTDNPIAAKLYAKFGFGFCPGSCVMARFSEGNMADFGKAHYQKVCGNIEISKGSPAMRIPIIPLVLQRDYGLILDINTGIFNSSIITQRSCMSLFPRYEALRAQGGDYYMAFDQTGTLGAISSVSPQTDGSFRADFFALSSFESSIASMICKIEKNFGKVYFEIARNDNAKERILQENGFHAIGESYCATNDFMIPTTKYSR